MTAAFIEELNHGSCDPRLWEYPTLEKAFVPGLLDDLVVWVRSITR